MIKSVWLVVFACGFNFSFGQVLNNQINHRFHLTLDENPVASTTANSSVEWQCINKALTNKCLVYHNDQWFSFTVPQPGSYYINLSQQVCNKKLGTQLILIEGNPCEVKSYRLVKCLSKLPQEDTFIKVDSLKAGTTYLINIDGFLGDACEFSIQVSSHPKGFPLPVATNEKITTETEMKKQAFKMTWFIEEERAPSLKEFIVLRSSPREPKAKEVNRQPIKRNTYGAYELRYTLTDTLPREDVYTYKIYGAQRENDIPILLTTDFARYRREPEILKQQIQRELILNLNYADGFPFKVIVFDPASSEQLFKYQELFNAAKDTAFKIDLGPFIDKGKKEFMIILSDFSAKGSSEVFYKLNGQGKLVKE